MGTKTKFTDISAVDAAKALLYMELISWGGDLAVLESDFIKAENLGFGKDSYDLERIGQQFNFGDQVEYLNDNDVAEVFEAAYQYVKEAELPDDLAFDTRQEEL